MLFTGRGRADHWRPAASPPAEGAAVPAFAWSLKNLSISCESVSALLAAAAARAVVVGGGEVGGSEGDCGSELLAGKRWAVCVCGGCRTLITPPTVDGGRARRRAARWGEGNLSLQPQPPPPNETPKAAEPRVSTGEWKGGRGKEARGVDKKGRWGCAPRAPRLMCPSPAWQHSARAREAFFFRNRTNRRLTGL